VQGKDAIRNAILLVNLMGQMIQTRLQKLAENKLGFHEFFESLDDED